MIGPSVVHHLPPPELQNTTIIHNLPPPELQNATTTQAAPISSSMRIAVEVVTSINSETSLAVGSATPDPLSEGALPPTSTQHHVETPPPRVVPHLVIHKCCPLGEVFSHQHAGCVRSEDWTFSVPIFTLDQFGGFIETNVTRDQVSVVSTKRFQ